MTPTVLAVTSIVTLLSVVGVLVREVLVLNRQVRDRDAAIRDLNGSYAEQLLEFQRQLGTGPDREHVGV